MRIVHLNHSDINGGAARAAYRIHHALLNSGVDSRMMVNMATSGDWTVQGPTSAQAKLATQLRALVGALPGLMLHPKDPTIHSASILPSRWPQRLNTTDVEIVHLHWVGKEMLSVADIGRIRKPIVWTLHDMWAFCGAEHYVQDLRWREGYHRENRPTHESGLDLNRWTWLRKRGHWRKPMYIVAPSRWLADCVRESALMKRWPVAVVPNALDTERWRPLPRPLARDMLSLPRDKRLLLFGAMGGGHKDPRKGFDLLLGALEQLQGQIQDLQLVVFGQLAPRQPPDMGLPIHYIGHLHDDLSLRVLYSAADALVVPSRQDNLPNTGVEAHACGTPVIAFATGGLPDIVSHKETGWLAQPFDTEDLAQGIRWVLADPDRQIRLREQARVKAVRRFAPQVVAKMYRAIYEEVICQSQLDESP